MDNTERLALFRSAETIEALQPAFQELLKEQPADLPPLLQEALEGLAEQPKRLADAQERRLLSRAFLLAGMAPCPQVYPLVLRILLSPEFGENVAREDWLSSEISRLLGILSPEDGVPALMEALLDESVCQVVSEQLLLTLSCRWIARRDSDSAFLECIRRLLTGLPERKVDFEMAMALVINAVAVGGDQLKPQVFAFYKAHAALLSDRLAEKNLQNFFDLGRQRIKAMLTGNYMGGYGPLPAELDRLVNYASIAQKEEEPTTLKALPPITRDRPKVGRNEPCPCGSGKKYKHCCGR